MPNNSEQAINIRDLQHYMYCKHRWGLLKIGSTWAENYYVTKANLLHNRVHNPENNYTAKGKKVFTSVAVYNDNPVYNLYGVLDCLEAIKSKDGVVIKGLDEKFKLCIVEYKPTKPKNVEYNEDDAFQVFAQKLCVDYIFSCDCEAVIYYADVKKRVVLPFNDLFDHYNNRLIAVIKEMRDNFSKGLIPDKEVGQKCSGCSLRNICLPINRRRTVSQKRLIQELLQCESY